jgi:hypothetical protein
VVDGGIFLRTAGKPKLTLAQKLKAFDLLVHGCKKQHHFHWRLNLDCSFFTLIKVQQYDLTPSQPPPNLQYRLSNSL